MFDCSDWRSGHNEFWTYDKDKVRLFDSFDRAVIKRFEQYQVPLILLRKETPKEAVCQVFEKVNTGGVSLTVFELLTADYAADDYNLRDDWDKRVAEFGGHELLSGFAATDFLQIITLLSTWDRRNRFVADNPG